jgi:subtilisin family serine protease
VHLLRFRHPATFVLTAAACAAIGAPCVAQHAPAPGVDRGAAVDDGAAVAPVPAGTVADDLVMLKLRAGARIAMRDDGSFEARDARGRPDARLAAQLAALGITNVTRGGTVTPLDAAAARAAGLDRWVEATLPPGTDARAAARALAARAGTVIELAEAVGIGGVAADAAAPNDPLYAQQYGLENTGQSLNGVAGAPGADVNARAAWHLSTGDSGTIVAVLDAGVDPHAEFAARMVPGWNVPAGNEQTGNQCSGHGTHCAGTIAAAGDDGTGMAGLAWNVRIMPVTVLTGCTGLTRDLADGLVWASDRGATVMNASLQYTVENQYLRDAIAYVMARGGVVVAAAGNGGTAGVAVPARWPEVVAVGALDSMDQVPSYSAVGPQVDCAAPGHRVLSAVGTSSYGLKDGTSMAAPFVAGTIALMRDAAPAFAAPDLVPFLVQSCVDVDVIGVDPRTGAGRIDAGAAVRAARLASGLGDLDGDGSVDGIDLGVVLGSWGACGFACAADLNDDGAVNGIDLGILIGNWGAAN